MLTMEGERTRLVEFGEEHLQRKEYRAWLRDPEVVTPIYRLEYLMPLPFARIEDHVRPLMGSSTDALFAIHLRDSDEFIGTFKLGHIDWRTGQADVGILIGRKDLWGKGYATEVVRTGVRYGFETLGLRRMVAGTPGGNVAMANAFLRLGFREEGRLRQCLRIGSGWQDHVLFGLFRDEFCQPEPSRDGT